MIEKLVETKSSIDNKAPPKQPAYHVLSEYKKKAKRIESLNLVSRLKENSRIVK